MEISGSDAEKFLCQGKRDSGEGYPFGNGKEVLLAFLVLELCPGISQEEFLQKLKEIKEVLSRDGKEEERK